MDDGRHSSVVLTRSVHTQDSTTRNSHVCAVQLAPFSKVVASGHWSFCPFCFGPRRASPVTSVSLPVSRSLSQVAFLWCSGRMSLRLWGYPGGIRYNSLRCVTARPATKAPVTSLYLRGRRCTAAPNGTERPNTHVPQPLLHCPRR